MVEKYSSTQSSLNFFFSDLVFKICRFNLQIQITFKSKIFNPPHLTPFTNTLTNFMGKNIKNNAS